MTKNIEVSKLANHPVITKDYPENKRGGIMVCGINFGFSKEEEALENAGVISDVEVRSFFSDATVNKTRFRDRLLTWMSSWGIQLATQPGTEGAFERSFFQTNWLETQTNSVTSDGVINSNVLVQEADGILNLLDQRRPAKIILVGSKLIDAINDIRLRARVESILGPRSGNAIIHKAIPSGAHKKHFKIYTQTFGDSRILCLPHAQSRGLTDEYMAAFKPVIGNFLLAE